MKRKYLLLVLVLLFPVFVYADTCDNSKIVISDVEKIESSGYVEEITSPEINNQSITTNLKLYDVGDSITYQFRVKNNSTDDYDLRKNISSDENVTYEIISDNNTIKSGEEKTIQLKVTYKNKVDESKYTNGKYVQNKEHNITLGDSIINPYTSTGISKMILLCIVMFILIVVSFVFVKGNKKYFSLLVLLLLPILVKASCLYRINIVSNIEFKKVIPNPCTFDEPPINIPEVDSFVKGIDSDRMNDALTTPTSEDSNTYNQRSQNHALLPNYINGQYGYDYVDELGGWSVILIDSKSTEPVTTKLCTSINGKPIVSMNEMFAGSQAPSIDLSSFDTSNVVNMGGMFVATQVTTLDLSNFDTSNVTNMSGMFANSQVTTLDISNFDTSNVVYMDGMFYKSKVNTLELSNFDMRKVEDASYMFCNVNPDIITKGQHFVELDKMYECVKALEPGDTLCTGCECDNSCQISVVPYDPCPFGGCAYEIPTHQTP